MMSIRGGKHVFAALVVAVAGCTTVTYERTSEDQPWYDGRRPVVVHAAIYGIETLAPKMTWECPDGKKIDGQRLATRVASFIDQHEAQEEVVWSGLMVTYPKLRAIVSLKPLVIVVVPQPYAVEPKTLIDRVFLVIVDGTTRRVHLPYGCVGTTTLPSIENAYWYAPDHRAGPGEILVSEGRGVFQVAGTWFAISHDKGTWHVSPRD